MIKHYLGLSLVSASLVLAGCSSSDDDADPGTTTAGTTTAGTTTAGTTTAGTTTAGTTTAGTTTAGATYMPPATATDAISGLLPAELLNEISNNPEISLADGTNYTIFAPTSAALTAASAAGGLLDPALSDADRAAVVNFHVVEGVYAAVPGATGANQIATGNLATANGATAAVVIDAAGNSFAGVNISTVDTFGTNGIVHTIDAVADPASGGTTTAGTTTAGTTTAGTTTAGTTTAGTTTGGAGGTACVQTAPVAGTMYAAVTENANLSSFMGLLQDNTLGQFCNNTNDAANGPWTMFAPTNAAIAAYTGTVETGTLQDHIHTNGSLEDEAALAAQAALAVGLTTARNKVLTVTTGPLTINGFTVSESIVTSNGTIHVIDGIIE